MKDGFTPVAFASSDGGAFRYNVSKSSDRWLGRILDELTQQQRDAGFITVRNGKYYGNKLIWTEAELSSETINYSPSANLQSFSFTNNQWYNETFPSTPSQSVP